MRTQANRLAPRAGGRAAAGPAFGIGSGLLLWGCLGAIGSASQATGPAKKGTAPAAPAKPAAQAPAKPGAADPQAALVHALLDGTYTPPKGTASLAQPAQPVRDLPLQPGQSQVLEFPDRMSRVTIVDPDVLDVVPTGLTTLVVKAKQVGETLLFVEFPRGRSIYRVAVMAPPPADLQQVASQIQSAIGNPAILVRAVGRTIFLEGVVPSQA